MHIRRPGGHGGTWMNVPGDRLLEPEGCTLVLATTWPTVNIKISQRILGDGEVGRLIGSKSIALSTSVARQGSRPHPKGTTMSFSLMWSPTSQEAGWKGHLSHRDTEALGNMRNSGLPPPSSSSSRCSPTPFLALQCSCFKLWCSSKLMLLGFLSSLSRK